MLKVLIAEDEKPAQDKLKRQLSELSNVELLSVADNGRTAVNLINDLKPDLVLLDIQMPGLNGFEVLEHIPADTEVVFTTAYDSFAVQAFEKAAVDYLLKPYPLARLKQALERVEQKLSARRGNLNGAPLISKVGNKKRVITPEHVSVFKSEDGTIMACGKGFSLPLDCTLDELEHRLSNQFLRVHRNAIINLNEVHEVVKWRNSNLLVRLNDIDVEVTTSRAGTARLKQTFSL